MRCAPLLLLVFCLMACQKKTYYIQSIENRSGNVLSVDVYWRLLRVHQASDEISPGETFLFRQLETNGLDRSSPVCYDEIDSIKVVVKDAFGRPFPVSIDWQSEAAWEQQTAEPSNFVEHSCNLIVDSSDVWIIF